MTDITIPDEVVEAAARAAHDQWRHECAIDSNEPVSNWQEWEYLENAEQESWREQARAAILAAIKAWPGMNVHEWQRPWLGGMSGSDLILPLPTQEN